eukprot:332126-Prymnesium_polylepis.1
MTNRVGGQAARPWRRWRRVDRRAARGFPSSARVDVAADGARGCARRRRVAWRVMWRHVGCSTRGARAARRRLAKGGLRAAG